MRNSVGARTIITRVNSKKHHESGPNYVVNQSYRNQYCEEDPNCEIVHSDPNRSHEQNKPISLPFHSESCVTDSGQVVDTLKNSKTKRKKNKNTNKNAGKNTGFHPEIPIQFRDKVSWQPSSLSWADVAKVKNNCKEMKSLSKNNVNSVNTIESKQDETSQLNNSKDYNLTCNWPSITKCKKKSSRAFHVNKATSNSSKTNDDLQTDCSISDDSAYNKRMRGFCSYRGSRSLQPSNLTLGSYFD